MRLFCMSRILSVAALVVLLAATDATWAGYDVNGYNFGLVQSASGLVNTAADVQTHSLWGVAHDNPITTTFTLPECQSVDFSRLYLDIYGGTPYHTAELTATLNDVPLPTLSIGGSGNLDDANPATHDPNTTCVYGSGFGYWQVAYAGVASLLKTDGSANTLTFTVASRSAQPFDGKTYGATLVTVYSDPSVNQTLDYQLFEGDAMMRGSSSTSLPCPQQNLGRSFAVTDVNDSDVVSATYTAGYAGAHSGQLDQIYFNETALGPNAVEGDLGNDIARAGYATEIHSFDVSETLAATNSVRYSIDGTALGGAGESVLYPDFGLLTVTHPVPEPSTIVMICFAGLALAMQFLLQWGIRQV